MRPEGVEPPTNGVEVRCSVQLSYGRASVRKSVIPQLSFSKGLPGVDVEPYFVWVLVRGVYAEQFEVLIACREA